jgi:uncharacterized glyoxalase superfamily protein PhnB
MRQNRSMPACTVIPELGYQDVEQAADWLCNAFGFALHLRIGNHRAQLRVGDGAVIVTQTSGDGIADPFEAAGRMHAVMVRVDDLDAHHYRALAYGATIMRESAHYPFGERQYSCRDPGGHLWTFSQTIADVAPEQWGGIALESTG